MRTGWARRSAWYIPTSLSGVLATGWQRVGPSWYYLSPDGGAMVTGWLRDGDAWYHLTSSGAMTTAPMDRRHALRLMAREADAVGERSGPAGGFLRLRGG